MREMFILIAHLLVTLAKLARPGGFRVVAAESLAVKHQLLIMKRSRQRAPNLTSWDRLTLGFCALFVSRERLSKMAVILKASTLLQFHQALVKRKYYLPFDEWTGVFASERLTGALLDRVCGELEAVEALDRWEPGFLDPALDGPPLPFDHLQLSQTQQVAGVVDAFGGALAGQLFVLAQEGRQPQRLPVMGEQHPRCVAHDAPPASRLR